MSPSIKQSCSWSGDDELMIRYHDREWGRPIRSDRKHFELLCLEGAQAGLSWRTVLYKRDAYRKEFEGFDPKKLARWTKAREARALKNPGIIRNRLKVASVVTNARAFLEVQKGFGSFNKFVWDFVDGKPLDRRPRALKELPATTPESDALSKELKKRGFKFVGSTIIYAYLQAAGLVNDHVMGCTVRAELRSK